MNLSLRQRRWTIVVAVCLFLFTVVGFFVLPPIIKDQAEQRLSAALGRKVTIGKVRLNPYALSVTIEQFNIRLKDRDGSFLGWDRLYVNFDLLSSLTGDWVLSDIALDGYHVSVVINPDGTLSFADLIERALAATAKPAGVPAAPAKPMRPIRIGHLAVNGARLEFSDLSRAKPFATVLGPVSFAMTNFRTAGVVGAPYHFEAVTEAGEKLSWTGRLAADPIESQGDFAIENLILKKYSPYFADKIRADLADGKLTVRGHYEAALDGEKRTLKLAGGEVHLRDLHVNERATGQAAVELPALDVTGISADAIALKARVEHVALTGGHLNVRREADGSLNLLTILTPEPATGPAQPAAAPGAPMSLPDARVEEVTVKDFKIDVTDNAAPRPAQLALSGLQFSLKNVSLADGAVMPLEASFTWVPQGTVHTAGSVTLKPVISADLKTDVSSLAILPLSPYLEEFANVRVTQGTVTTSNTLHAVLPASGGMPAVTFAGDITVEKFGLVDGVHNEDLAGFATFTLKDLKASTTPQLTVSLSEVNIAGPYARVVINPDKSINLLTVLLQKRVNPVQSSAPAVPSEAAAKEGAPTPLPKVEVGKIIITDGNFSFSDHSLEPNVRMGITQFGGSITGLSSSNPAKADVDLKGVVDGAGPMAISGKLDPLGAVRSLDIKVDYKNIDLLPISPYTGKFAGYELVRGKLVVDTKVTVEGNKLSSTNVITLHQFTFGAATNSPDAVHLPVRLGVALLKDLDGNILIDVPIEGSIDDPDFHIGKVVWRVIGNLLAKAATSPFSLLGSMFGGGGEELAFQEFNPGASELKPTELPKLDTLVKALTNRPALSLGLEGSYDAAADGYAVKRQKFADLVRRQIWEAQHAANPNIPPPEKLEITPEANAAMVKKLFDAKFPPGTQFGTPLPAAPVVAAPPPPPPPGFVKSVFNAISFHDTRAKSAAKKEAARLAAEHEQAVAAAEAAGLPLEEMTGRMAETMVVNDDDLRALAAARALRVRDQLINTGHIAADRLFLSQGTDATKQNKGPRVFLSLQ